MNATVKKLEEFGARQFKSAPNLSERSREALVGAWPWIAIVFGVLQIFAAWALWQLMNEAELSVGYASLCVGPGATTTGIDRVALYLGIVALLVDAAIVFTAYPALRVRQVRRWQLLGSG